jgi:uncharacterized protein (TIGR02246 family)
MVKTAIMSASFAALSLPAAAQEVPLPPNLAPQAAIGAQFNRWIDAFETCDAGALSSIFTRDAVYAANTGQVLIGRDHIRAGVQGWMEGPLKPACQKRGMSLNVERQPVRMTVLDGVGYNLTRFVIRVEPMKCTIDAGHILGVWQRQPSGEWLLAALTGNKDPMPPANPCPS